MRPTTNAIAWSGNGAAQARHVRRARRVGALRQRGEDRSVGHEAAGEVQRALGAEERCGLRLQCLVLLALLRDGRSVALTCDAGTPAISDPGALLVAAARADQERIRIVQGLGHEQRNFFGGMLPVGIQRNHAGCPSCQRQFKSTIETARFPEISFVAEQNHIKAGQRPVSMARTIQRHDNSTNKRNTGSDRSQE